ncbi:uncharacterized protein LOC136759054 [Amia ocellicauda]|uniref:uncharacterized protein LOC136759054 n=1 Tax=Amia ocellicauda TaxID=2972642 RepID=UPI003464E254
MADSNIVHLPEVVFKQQKETVGAQKVFTVLPVSINFHKLLRMTSPPFAVPKTRNDDVLCAVIALYDVSLPDVGPQDVHTIVHSSTATTIVLFRHHKEVLEEYRQGSLSHTHKDPAPLQLDATTDPQELRRGRFSEVFSDTESSAGEDEESGEESDWEDWEKFDSRVNEFLLAAKDRRSQRLRTVEKKEIPPRAVGIESLIVAAATYEVKRLKCGERVLQLALLSTRKRYKQCGAGRYLLELLKDASVCGSYHALLTHADSDAVPFFSKCGFTDDILLNNKFRELEDDWINTTMMSYFPPFSTNIGRQNPVFLLNLSEVELEMQLWREKSLAAYQGQAVCMSRLLHEVQILRKELVSQKEQIDSLSQELERERQRRHMTEQRFLEYRLEKTRQILDMSSLSSDEQDHESSADVCPWMGEENENSTKQGPKHREVTEIAQ